mgnify:CR=1 FL=1
MLHPTGDKPATELGYSNADSASDNPSHRPGDLAPNFEQDIRAWQSLNIRIVIEEPSQPLTSIQSEARLGKALSSS